MLGLPEFAQPSNLRWQIAARGIRGQLRDAVNVAYFKLEFQGPLSVARFFCAVLVVIASYFNGRDARLYGYEF